MKILIITSEIIVNKYSGSIRTSKIIKELSEIHDVDVLTEPMSIWNFDHNINEIHLTDFQDKIKYQRGLKRKVLSKYFHVNLNFKKRFSAFMRSIKNMEINDYDCIIALSAGDFFVPHKVLTKIKTDARKIGYIHDPYPMDLYPEPYRVSPTKKSEIEKNKFKRILHNIDVIAFPSLLLGESMNDYYKFGEDKICVLPHLLPNLNVNKFEDDNAISFLKEQNIIKGKFYLHAGTLLKHRNVFEIIKQFKSLKKNNEIDSDFKLLLIGNVNYKIQESDEDVVIVKNRLNLELINGISNYAKSLIIVEHISDFSPFLPGKLPECIAHEKKIMHFGPFNSEICRVVGKFTDIDLFSAHLDNASSIRKVLKNGGIDLSKNKELVDYFKIDNFLKSLF